MTENLVSGKKYRILTDAVNDVWDRISFWTKASDVYYNDNTTAEANKPTNVLKRSTAYSVGTIAYCASAPSWVMLRCTTAGTTAEIVPTTYSTITSVGTVITDGTARFTVYDARPSSTLSSSSYQIPTMNLVNNLNSELTANGNKFYFAYNSSTGKYGYRLNGSGTFVPFGGTGGATKTYTGISNFTLNKGTSQSFSCSSLSSISCINIGSATWNREYTNVVFVPNMAGSTVESSGVNLHVTSVSGNTFTIENGSGSINCAIKNVVVYGN